MASLRTALHAPSTLDLMAASQAYLGALCFVPVVFVVHWHSKQHCYTLAPSSCIC